jgi:hypothetical protein
MKDVMAVGFRSFQVNITINTLMMKRILVSNDTTSSFFCVT